MTQSQALFPYAILCGAVIVWSMVAMWAKFGRARKMSILLSVVLYGLITLNMVAAFIIGYLVIPSDKVTGMVMMVAVVLMPSVGFTVMGLILRWRRDKDL